MYRWAVPSCDPGPWEHTCYRLYIKISVASQQTVVLYRSFCCYCLLQAPGVNEADTITMNTGQPVWSYNESMTLGRRGPVLLEDMQLIEKMQQVGAPLEPGERVPILQASSPS